MAAHIPQELGDDAPQAVLLAQPSERELCQEHRIVAQGTETGMDADDSLATLQSPGRQGYVNWPEVGP